MDELKKARYRLKEGCGKHHFKQNGEKKTVVPGGYVDVCPYEIEAFKEKFERVSEVVDKDSKQVKPASKEKNEDDAAKADLVIKHAGAGKYNVLTSSGSKINDQPLTKQEAELLAGEEKADMGTTEDLEG